MHYLPSDLINRNYTYSYNNQYYVVRTNKNCYTNYNTQYCDCVNVFPNNDYLVSNTYSCTLSTNNVVSYNSFTSDFYYRNDLYQLLIIFTILFLFIIYMPYKIISRWFGRWLKV